MTRCLAFPAQRSTTARAGALARAPERLDELVLERLAAPLGKPGDMIFLPPFTQHSLQAIEDEPVTALSAWAF